MDIVGPIVGVDKRHGGPRLIVPRPLYHNTMVTKCADQGGTVISQCFRSVLRHMFFHKGKIRRFLARSRAVKHPRKAQFRMKATEKTVEGTGTFCMIWLVPAGRRRRSWSVTAAHAVIIVGNITYRCRHAGRHADRCRWANGNLGALCIGSRPWGHGLLFGQLKGVGALPASALFIGGTAFVGAQAGRGRWARS